MHVCKKSWSINFLLHPDERRSFLVHNSLSQVLFWVEFLLSGTLMMCYIHSFSNHGSHLFIWYDRLNNIYWSSLTDADLLQKSWGWPVLTVYVWKLNREIIPLEIKHVSQFGSVWPIQQTPFSLDGKYTTTTTKYTITDTYKHLFAA